MRGGSFEVRSPKSEGRKKAEIRRPKPDAEGDSDFDLRPSDLTRVATNRGIQPSRVTTDRAPSPWGEGRGEGERGRRTDAAGQNVFGTRETEPQFLAALDCQASAHCRPDVLRRPAAIYPPSRSTIIG